MSLLSEQSESTNELEQQLAASQAREKVMQDALRKIGKYPRERNDEFSIVSARRVANAALTTQPTDDTALKAALAAERERVYEAVDRELEPRVSRGIRDVVEDAIRRLGDEK